MKKIEEIQDENAKNYSALAKTVAVAIAQTGTIVHDLHKYFEQTALVRNAPTPEGAQP